MECGKGQERHFKRKIKEKPFILLFAAVTCLMTTRENVCVYHVPTVGDRGSEKMKSSSLESQVARHGGRRFSSLRQACVRLSKASRPSMHASSPALSPYFLGACQACIHSGCLSLGRDARTFSGRHISWLAAVYIRTEGRDETNLLGGWRRRCFTARSSFIGRLTMPFLLFCALGRGVGSYTGWAWWLRWSWHEQPRVDWTAAAAAAAAAASLQAVREKKKWNAMLSPAHPPWQLTPHPFQPTHTCSQATMSRRKFRAPRHGSLGFLVRCLPSHSLPPPSILPPSGFPWLGHHQQLTHDLSSFFHAHLSPQHSPRSARRSTAVRFAPSPRTTLPSPLT